ncbi:hypothetical protein [Maribacter sp. 2210JD10-5]|uniref:hypothetical protein n=1 Tax=Maribacter sp. 2210JD10-5 TaxID=3386272 RepID=UPI0039BCA212
MKNRNKLISSIVFFGFLINQNVSAFNVMEATNPFNDVHMNSCAVEKSTDDEGLGNFDISHINLIEIEQEVNLGFDTYNYLPLNFDPYEGMTMVLNEIEVIDTEEEIDLGFDVKKYLPKDFNPYSCVK